VETKQLIITLVFATEQELIYWSALMASVLYLLLIRPLALNLNLRSAAEKELNVGMEKHMKKPIAAIRPNVLTMNMLLHIALMLLGRQNALMENPHLARSAGMVLVLVVLVLLWNLQSRAAMKPPAQ